MGFDQHCSTCHIFLRAYELDPNQEDPAYENSVLTVWDWLLLESSLPYALYFSAPLCCPTFILELTEVMLPDIYDVSIWLWFGYSQGWN